MKKRLICMLLVVVMLVTSGVPAAYAAAELQGDVGDCGHEIPQDQWTAWDGTGGESFEGHFYLDDTFTGQTETVKVEYGREVCLDLRGNTWITEGIRTLSIEGTLTVMDSVGGGQILVTGEGGATGAFAYVYEQGTLNICGGTIRHIPREDITIVYGGLIYVNGGKLNVKGGVVAGGTTKSTTSTAQGGNIYVTNSGVINISGGAVTAGMARKVGTKGGQGGNIYALNSAVVNISGGTVSDGYADSAGGNIFIASATLNVTGGTITGGYALENGGNICQVSTGTNTVKISGGTITGGVAGGTLTAYSENTFAKGSGGGGNYYGKTTKGTLHVTGGTISGDMKLDGLETVILSGAPKIGLGKSNGLHFNSTAIKADVSGLEQGAEIYVYATDVFTAALTNETAADTALSYFKGAVRTGLSVSENALKGTQGTTGYCPHCAQEVTWTKGWNAIGDITSGTAHRYLATSAAAHVKINADIIIDLNGYTACREGATTASPRIATVTDGNSLTVLDSYGGGKLASTGNLTENADIRGGVVYVTGTSAAGFTLLSGTVCRLDAYTETNTGKTSYVENGGVIYGHNYATIDIQGGVIRDGIVNEYHSSFAGAAGGNIGMNNNKGTLRISGGLILGGTAQDTVFEEETYSGKGGNIYCHGTTNISGGMILDGSATDGGNVRATGTKLTLDGGVISNGHATMGGNISSKTTIDITGGLVTGGVATETGGNLYLYESANAHTIRGGALAGGTAKNGGNIYQNGTSTVNSGSLTVSGGEVLCGKATVGGGNILFTYSTLHVQGSALIAGGYSKDLGGNIYIASRSTANVTGGVIVAGSAEDRGGNFYCAAYTNQMIVSGGKISDGTAVVGGGNAYLNNGNFTITGGVIEGGSSNNGGNIFVNVGYSTNTDIVNVATFQDDGDPSTAPGQIIGGTATGVGGNIYFKATGNANGAFHKMVLGNCVIQGGQAGEAGGDLYVNTAAYLEVLPEFAQTLTAYFHEDLVDAAAGKLDSQRITCNGVYSGKLYMEGEGKNPQLFTSESDPALYMATAALVDHDGTVVWYADNAAAVAKYDETVKYMLPMAGELELRGGSYVVDLFGQDLTISGSGTVTCFDSANNGLDSNQCGSATIVSDQVVLGNDPDMTLDEKYYIAVEKDGAYTFHLLSMRVSGISVRPGNAGMYYRCTWEFDDVLKTQLVNYGVAVSLVDMPDDTFNTTDGDTLYTCQDAAALVSGQFSTSVLIKNILSTEADNNSWRGQQGIYAAPYVMIQDGDKTKNLVATVETKYSLCDTLKLLEQASYYDNKIALENFYNTWEAAMSTWGFEKIGVKPSDDTTLRLLMVGNSFCYYYVEELYALLMENPPAGIDSVEIYNLYYSGCTLIQHHTWWTQGLAKYDLYRTDAHGRNKLGASNSWTLEAALAQGNWDYISLQGNSGSYLTDDMDALCEQMYANAGPLLNRFHDQFPYAKLLWHRTWAFEVGRVSGSTVYDEALLEQYDANMQYACEKMCQKYAELGLTMVNTGVCWTKARQLAEGTDLLPYGGLCARLGKNSFGDGSSHSGDGYHDGDIGGAQLLNAYVWYMAISGDTDLTDSTYAPVYSYGAKDYPLSADFIALLKRAAMEGEYTE